jgi:hypothetical protein
MRVKQLRWRNSSASLALLQFYIGCIDRPCPGVIQRFLATTSVGRQEVIARARAIYVVLAT